jgi:amidase/aspartyl-tRNA(Asn)/glutamyl-tRNA(Gln) amidotransferase subunit A
MAGEGWAGFATSGPMARNVADTALGLDVIAGPAIGDPYWTPKPERSYLSALDARVRPLKIGWTVSATGASVDAEVAAAVERAAGVLRDLGHVVEPAAPDTSGMWEPFLTIVRAHTGAMPVPDPDQLGPHARAVFDAGRTLSAAEYLAADLEVYRTSRRVLSWFEQYDVLLCPTLTRTPPPLGELSGAGEEVWNKLERYIAFTFWVNMTGQPAYSLPLATSTSGLPIGVQIVGRQLAEHTLIGLAGQLEQAMPWRDRLPPAAS